MNAIQEYLASEKYEPELYDDYGWKLLDQARAELAQLRADLQAAHQRIAELEWSQVKAANLIANVCLEAYIDEQDNSRYHMRGYVIDECEKWMNEWHTAHPETSTRAGA